jgi:arsenate reductase-like glutaredoxin family protein
MRAEILGHAFIAVSELTKEELAFLIRAMQSPFAPTVEQSQPAKKAINNCKRWSDDEVLQLLEVYQETLNASLHERHRKLRALARQLGRTDDGVKRKIWDLKQKGVI